MNEKNLTHYFQKRDIYLSVLEIFGTALLTYGLSCQFENVYLGALTIFAPLFIITDLTGAHFNCAITLLYMIKPKKMLRISLKKGLSQMINQIVGGLLGGAFTILILDNSKSPITWYDNEKWILADFFGEILGAFTFITFFLVQNHIQTKITNDRLWGSLIIVIGMIMGRSFAFHSQGVLNPNVAFGVEIMNCLLKNNFGNLRNIWIFILAPFLGGLMSLLFYLQIYKPNLKARILQRHSKFITDLPNDVNISSAKNMV